MASDAATEAEGVAIVPGEAFRVKQPEESPGQLPGVRQVAAGCGDAGAISQ